MYRVIECHVWATGCPAQKTLYQVKEEALKRFEESDPLPDHSMHLQEMDQNGDFITIAKKCHGWYDKLS